ncbi:MAG: autotransporter assembly complex family protein [Burkholderiaceae bacterium]
MIRRANPGLGAWQVLLLAAFLFFHAAQAQTANSPVSAASAPGEDTQAPRAESVSTPVTAAGPSAEAFGVEIEATKEVRDYLRRHLELMRYRELADLDDVELERLMLAADSNVRELLGTLGYFSPDVDIHLQKAPSEGGAPRQVVIKVEPGPATRISAVSIAFRGAIADDPATAKQRAEIRSNWPLAPGMRFTQAAWDSAKSEALRLLRAERYPVGQVFSSRAEIDPQTQTAQLSVTLDSGDNYRLGALQVTGLENYDPVLVERIARLAPGSEYDRDRILEAQQRLQDSGYFDSVFLSLDTSGDPDRAPVLVTVREAKRKKVVLGVGVSTDSGARLTVEHTNQRLPVIGWRAVSKLQLDRDTKSIGTELTGQPGENNWRWVTSGQLKDEDVADVAIRSQTLRAGRTKSSDKIDRNVYLQYERADTTTLGVSTRAQAISANYAWTFRNFDSLPFPSSGYGLAVELGGGFTLGNQKEPFVRTLATWLTVLPLSKQSDALSVARAGRIALRLQGGAVIARDRAVLPSTQLFLTGGDATVRGYAYRDIGAREVNGQVVPGRYLAVGSVEWQRPIILNGRPSEWESTLFLDAGAVADKTSQLKPKVGIGAGVRWKSPVGPLQIDLAYGVAVKRLRLHLSVGFTF